MARPEKVRLEVKTAVGVGKAEQVFRFRDKYIQIHGTFVATLQTGDFGFLELFSTHCSRIVSERSLAQHAISTLGLAVLLRVAAWATRTEEPDRAPTPAPRSLRRVRSPSGGGAG